MSVLGDAVQARIQEQDLIDLTNDDGVNASSINTTRLEAAVTDAVSFFELETGLPYTETDARHVAYCVPGVMWKLEEYRQRDSNFLDKYRSAFFAGLKGISSKRTFLFTTSSTLEPSTEAANSLPDLDRSKPALGSGRNRIGSAGRNDVNRNFG